MEINKLVADRIKNQEGYRFTSLMELKEKVKKDSRELLLDFGIGEQRCGAPNDVIKVLNEESINPNNHVYSDNGIKEFNEKVSKYFKEEYNLYFDPKTEINHCMGIKSALTILPLCLINTNDYILTTSPGYVVIENMAKWIGAKIKHIELKKENNYLFDLNNIDEEILRKTKLLYINYPNNPTGAIANEEFYRHIIEFAKKYNFIVINDAAYIDLTFNKEDRISFMQVEGAKDIGVELHSFSKGYNMTGFRIGYIIGNKDIIKMFKLVKDNMDSGQFIPIQKSAIKALDCRDFIENNCQKIKNRHVRFKEICKNNNIMTEMPKATFYQFVDVPKYIEYNDNIIQINNGNDFSLFLLKELKIMTIPYENNVRFSLTFNSSDDQEENYIFNLLDRRFKTCKFIY